MRNCEVRAIARFRETIPILAGFAKGRPGHKRVKPAKRQGRGRARYNGGAMPEDKFTDALKKAKEIKITVIGRNTGKEISLPVWFVHEKDTLWLLPVNGSKTQWYQNLLKKPTITIKVGKEERTLNAHVLKTTTTVRGVIQSFQQKYKPEMIARFYPGPLDVAVKVEM